jgi:hypothetical protein
MEKVTSIKVSWIVADLSSDANSVVAGWLGCDCDQNQIDSFSCKDGQEHKGYYVPNYGFITSLKQMSSRKNSGISFTVFKQEGESFTKCDFREMKKKTAKTGG